MKYCMNAFTEFFVIADMSPKRPVEMQLGGGGGQPVVSEGMTPSMLSSPSAQMAPGAGCLEGVAGGGDSMTSSGGSGAVGSVNRRVNYEKWEDEERLGDRSTIAPVLYANTVHPELKTQCPDPRTRAREIQKLWRRLPSENRSRFVVRVSANISVVLPMKVVFWYAYCECLL